MSGVFSFDFVPRWIHGTDVGDEDIYVSVQLDWGRPESPYSGSIYWRGVTDVDGPSTPPSSLFHSVYDDYGDGGLGQLLYAYADLRSDGPLRLFRAGRQYVYHGQPFHFDGLKLRTRRGAAGFCASAFAGAPVRYFEEVNAGDWLAGGGLELSPWGGGKLVAVYAHVAGDAGFAGVSGSSDADDLLVLGLSSRLGNWGAGQVRYTEANGEVRDVALRAQASFSRIGTDASIRYYAQPGTLEQFTIDLSAFDLVAGASYPHDRVDVSVSKGFRIVKGWRASVAARGTARRLRDAADEGEYNRDYDLLYTGVGLEAPERRKLSAEIGQTWWWSSGDDVRSFDAELRWRPNEKLLLGAGTGYSLYRYNLLSLAEEADVRETFLRARWMPGDRMGFDLKYAAEDRGGDLIHKMEMGCSVKF